MASASDCLFFSNAAYRGPGGYDGDLPQGWMKIAESAHTEGNPAGTANNYFGAAYMNANGEIVVANRGSASAQDWLVTDRGIAQQDPANVPPAFTDAEKFAKSIQQRYPNHPITFTGHSLGGAEAQVQAALSGMSAKTFAAPGAAFAVNAEQARDAASRVTNYVLPGDLIGDFGDHIGGEPKRVGSLTSGAAKGGAAAAAGVIAGGGILGALVTALVLAATNHPIANYLSAFSASNLSGEAAEGAGGGGGGGMPAARLGDMHVCPMVTGLVPHVGGPVAGPGCTSVLISGMPAARVGDMAICVGPLDVIVLGSSTVLIGGMPAARLGSLTAHGGALVMGAPSVLIGG